MQIPEWYTGSDLTGRVAAEIESVIERMDARIADHEDVTRLQDVLSLEEEPNWRCFLRGLVGTIYYDLEEIDSAREHLAEAVAGYKVYLMSFDEVLSVYCQSCYTLGVILFDDGLYGDALPCFMRCLPYMNEVYDETYIGHIYTFLALCSSWTNQTLSSVVFSEAAYFKEGEEQSDLRLRIARTAHGGARQRRRDRQGRRRLPPAAEQLPGLREHRPRPRVRRAEPR